MKQSDAKRKFCSLVKNYHFMNLLLFFEEKCTPGWTYLIRLGGLDFTALVARVLSISPRKLQTSSLFDVKRPREKCHNHTQNVHFVVFVKSYHFMKMLLFFEEKCTPGKKYLIRLAGLDFTALVARVLSISPRKLQTSTLFDVKTASRKVSKSRWLAWY